jgi:hypothetical protein
LACHARNQAAGSAASQDAFANVIPKTEQYGRAEAPAAQAGFLNGGG